jgi:hypothetical protein
MAKRSSKKRKLSGSSNPQPPLDPMRRGMPAQDSIVGVKEVTRGGKTFRIIKTSELDEYDRTPKKKRKKPQG